MLGVTGFLWANCASYFVRSGSPYVTGWGMPPGVHVWFEEIGFPFVIYSLSIGGIVPQFRCPWINWVGNVVVAVTVSYVLAIRLARHLPPLWPGQSRAFRYSLRGLLGTMVVVGVLLGMGTASRLLGLLVRNIVCLAGPVGVYAWCLYGRQLGWVRLTVAALGLTLMALAIDLPYQEPPIDGHAVVNAILPILEPTWSSGSVHRVGHPQLAFTTRLVGLTVVRSVVPVFGLLSLFVIVSAAYSAVRHYHRGRKGHSHET